MKTGRQFKFMGFRVVLISKRSKLEFRMNYLIVRTKEGINKIFIDEISVLLIENNSVCITTVLLCELVQRNIDVIFCDNNRNPNSELHPLYGSHDSTSKLREQINWKMTIKELVWTEIIKEKIRKQIKRT